MLEENLIRSHKSIDVKKNHLWDHEDGHAYQFSQEPLANVTRNTFDSKNSHSISTKLILHTGH